MNITDEDRRLLEVARKLESRKCREMLIAQAEAMFRAQEAYKADYSVYFMQETEPVLAEVMV